MPRAHTLDERERIRERLLQAGCSGFGRVGLAKITIAELAREAGIGKGSFYQFFESKEELFLAVQEQQEAMFKASLARELERAASGRQAVHRLLTVTATRLDDHPFLRLLLDPQTIATLTLRIPPERLAAHREADREYFIGLLRGWKRRGWLRHEVDPQVAFDVLTAIFAISLQRELLGADVVQRAVEELATSVAERWCPSRSGRPGRERGAERRA
ncbi:TetR/AcrR family transcriptional regulator [Paraliomyxa miuraensis]|uniref:TetR/AcrR family transcriptional regulator n=1 Tax=Paraliomyxa miuraensis TaxID=376150 RepID=UPI0022548F80|nr:TetR/AcrR family transcriptional regulator [Paraliomyxa miuraensis]MCX4247052.1 TetR/AcrR family transcriptional regulator [Paraliomyxa miuraensis]